MDSHLQKFKEKLESEFFTHAFPSPNADILKTRSKAPRKPVLQNSKIIEVKDAKPIEPPSLENIVNAYDKRIKVDLTSEWPNSVHGALIVDFGDSNIKSWGTGTLIGLNIVLTAGHNLYNPDTKTQATLGTMQFFPGMNGQKQKPPFGFARVAKYFISPNFIKNGTDDYGLLILEEPIGEMTGYFGLFCPRPGQLEDKKVNVTGYPSDKEMYEMWGMEGLATDIDYQKNLINYIIDTAKGQSGSGVWFKEDGEYYVCGVHVSGGRTMNTATLLTRRMYEQIHKWIYEAVPGEYLVNLEEKKELAFCDQKIDVDCLSALMKYNLDGLKILDLNYRKISTEGVKILALNTSWAQLTQLRLDGNDISLEGIKELAQNPHWTNLTYLSLCHNNIGSEGAKELAKNQIWQNLSFLSLGHNEIGAEGVAALASNTCWTNLTQLYLHKNGLCAEGARELAKNRSWVKLSRLYLHVNQLDRQGAIELARNTSWVNLVELHLNGNNLEKKDILTQNRCWRALKKEKIFI